MKIAVDLRSLLSGTVSGVENYTLNLTEALLEAGRPHSYLLFESGFRPSALPEFHYVNAEPRRTRLPNKLVNLGFMAGLLKLERFTGPVDWLLLPNLNQFAVRPETKVAVTVHDLSPIVSPERYDAKRRFWHALLRYRRVFQRADVVFTVSDYTRSDVLRLFGLPETRVVTVPPGADHFQKIGGLTEDFLRDVRNRLELPGSYALFLNTIEPRKNLPVLLKAFELLPGDYNLVVAGRPGWKYRRQLEALAGSAASRRIRFLGYLSSERDKAAVIKLARCLVYPSFYEGFGFQPLEAAWLGTPSVVSQVTALPEVAAGSALLVDPYSVASVLRGLEAALKDGELRTQLVARAQGNAKRFTWRRSAEQVLDEMERRKR